MDRHALKVGVGGAAVVGVAFGMARYAYGLTLPDVRTEFGLSELLLGLIASGTFVGYLAALLAVPSLTARRGPRAPTTVGGICGVVGATTVALAPSPWILAAGAVVSGSAAGWVWAPYSDIVTRIAARRHQPTLLAVITTGTSLGLVALAATGVLGSLTSWRLTWAGIAVAAAVAALVNLRAVPRLDAGRRTSGTPRRSPWRREMAPPLIYAVVYFVAITAYFTYASEAVRSGGLPASASPGLFAVIGIGGLIGLRTGRMTRAVGPRAVGAGGVLVVGGALVLLSAGRASLPLVLASALLFGAGYMVGSSLLAIWTAQAVPDRPGDGFTIALVVGAVVSIATPAAMGTLIPTLGLPTMLVAVAAVVTLGASTLALPALRPTPGEPGPDRRGRQG
ncbi:MFS transporter [Cellulomonas bogoriensis]|uniref:Arabinose ABC transporter permease n=1 Tax=Cellulomonas bogoriensis 69B4 = DSM 16987 TaxID=1386082 RepID=A0A0A0C4C5_9CELL|nr:MFS transporter [Cellulomonas bogoriensis]KGM14209.1 arabinose ABC transporter permease [Cellulomonas bogoriensis 69B4 = DSM 16987]